MKKFNFSASVAQSVERVLGKENFVISYSINECQGVRKSLILSGFLKTVISGNAN